MTAQSSGRGELEELEKARDHILRFLNERIRELEG